MGDKVKVREVLLYSEKIKSEDVLNFFNQIMKSRLPLFGFLDFSDFLSLNVVNTIIKRKLNTVQFFIRDKKSLAEISLLVFPYKLSDQTEIEKISGTFLPFPKFYFLMGNQDFLGFTVKESMEEVNLRIMKVLGKFIAVGTAVDERKQKHIVICASPERFYVSDLEKNPSVYIEILDPIPKRMSVTSQYPVFEESGISVGVDNFDVFQHTLFVGASGTGKSKGLYAMIKAIEAKYKDGVRMVIIDPHGEFIRVFPEAKVVNLIDNYIEPLDVGGIKTPLMTQLIAQLLSSTIGQENKYSERVLFYATHLLSSIDKMDLRNISLLLTDSSKRAEFISETENDEVKRFFDEEFNDIYIHHFNDAVLPILNFVGEYELYLGGDKKRENLLDLVKNNRITIVSFNPNFFGKRMINFLAGAIINQMYILAITERLNSPTILVMDEFQRVETRVVKDILSETRKFNLYVYLSMQYLGQLTKEVRDSIVSNIRNIVAFKSNREDATMLSSIMEIKIEESFKKSRTNTELEESKKEMFVRLHQKECIVRLFEGKKYILPMKLRVVDVYQKWGYHELPLEQVMPMPKVPPSMMKKGEAQEAMHEAEHEEPAAAETAPFEQHSQQFSQPSSVEPVYQPDESEQDEDKGQNGESKPARKKSAVELQIEAAKKSASATPPSQGSGNEWMDLKPERELHSAYGRAADKNEEDKSETDDEGETEDKGQTGEDERQIPDKRKPQETDDEGETEDRGQTGEGETEEITPEERKPREEEQGEDSELDSEELSDEAVSVPEDRIRQLEEDLMFNEEEAPAKPAKKKAAKHVFDDETEAKPPPKKGKSHVFDEEPEIVHMQKKAKPPKITVEDEEPSEPEYSPVSKKKAKAPSFEEIAYSPPAKKHAKRDAEEDFVFPPDEGKPSPSAKKSAKPAKKTAPAAKKSSPAAAKKPAGKKKK